MSDARWLAATWPFVRDSLPPAPASVVEIGCGPLGGFVPQMLSSGYDAVGVDPEAPDAAGYHRTEFEHHEPAAPVAAVVASTSLHHVAELADVLDRIGEVTVPGATLVVVEWAHERFDEPSARWCFDRLPMVSDDEPGWLHRHRDQWKESGLPWDAYFRGWVTEERMHPGRDIVRGLQERWETVVLDDGPYFFAELDGVTPDAEQAAIDAGLVQATGIRFVGRGSRS